MNKNIAIVWGGFSSEKIVSEKSMQGIYTFLDKSVYNIYKVQIDKAVWVVDSLGQKYNIDKNDFSFTQCDGSKVKFDFAYITIHGTPGEDGRLQGYFDLLGIPYSSCGVMASALTMNKFICNNFLKNFGVNVPQSLLLRMGDCYKIEEIVDNLKLPLFVKPNLGGSSFATTKVKTIACLSDAIQDAFKESDEVIIESFIAGREVTCGCYKIADQLVVLPITEVVTSNEFFDYNAKYEGEVQEITPANIGDVLTDAIQQQTMHIYKLIGAKGIIRADYIISDGQPVLLEVNTTPGMTSTSFIPQQISAAKLNITSVLSAIIDNELIKNV